MSGIQNNPIGDEILKIIKDRETVRYAYKYFAFIHMPDNNDLTYQALKVLTIDYNRDYENNISDEVTCTLMVSPGTWSDIIYPHVKNLEISIVRGIAGASGTGGGTITRYKAYCKNPQNYRKTNAHLQAHSTQDIDRQGTVNIEFQLVPILIEKLLPVQIGCNVVDATIGDTLKSLLYSESTKVEGLDQYDQLQGVDMVDADNTDQYTNIPIPDGVKLTNLPNYLQKFGYGIYKHGIGHYIQNGFWYVYPRLKDKREDSQVRYINIYLSNKDTMKYADITYSRKGEDLYIIGTLDGESNTNVSATLLNEGNGVRAVNPATQNTEETVKVENNKAILNRNQSVNEFIVQNSPTGTNNVPLKIGDKDTNIYEQVAKVQGRLGKMFGITWQNSNPDLVKPGSLVRVHYAVSSTEQAMVEGVVLKAHHYSHALNNNMKGEDYATVTGLFIYSIQVNNQNTQ